MTPSNPGVVQEFDFQKAYDPRHQFE